MTALSDTPECPKCEGAYMEWQEFSIPYTDGKSVMELECPKCGHIIEGHDPSDNGGDGEDD